MSKVKVLFNSSCNFNQGSIRIPFYAIKSEFEKFDDIDVFENDFENYNKYDVLICPAESDYVDDIKTKYPDLVICLTKPHYERLVTPIFKFKQIRTLFYLTRLFYPESWSQDIRSRKKNWEKSNLVIADSHYLNQYFESQKINSVYIRLIEKYDCVKTSLSESGNVVFGYHGNYKHFNESLPYILPALVELSQHFNVTLKVMTNLNGVKGFTDPRVNIVYKEYSYPGIYTFLSDIDIGLVPNNIPVRGKIIKKFFESFGCVFWKTDRKHDLILRYKQSANAGRAYVFAQLGKPFISCPVPDVCIDFGNILEQYLPIDTITWHKAIIGMAHDKGERDIISNRLLRLMSEKLTLENEAKKLKNALLDKIG